MERIRIYLDDQYVGTMVCRQCGIQRTVNLRQQCPHVLDLTGVKRATITCRCGTVFQAQFALRRHPRKVVQLRGELVDPQTCTKLSDMVISSLSVQGLGFVLAANLRLQVGEVYTASFRIDDVEQSRIHEPILIRRFQGNMVGAEFYPVEQYNYALDFYVYGCHLLPPPRPVPARAWRSPGTIPHLPAQRRGQQSFPVAV